MPSILVATGFVRIDADTKPALKALQALGSIGGNFLATAIGPAAAAASAAIGAVAASAATAGAAVGVYGVAVKQQFSAITEVMQKKTAADDADTKATNAKAIAQRLAKDMGIKYGQSIQITSKMTEEAKQKAQTYNSALSAATSATKTAKMAQEGYKSAMKELPPETEKTAEALQNLKDTTKSWSDSLSSTTMPVFTKGIQFLTRLLPTLTPIVKSVATQVDQFVDGLGEGAAGRIFREFGDNVTKNGAGALRTFLEFGKNMVAGILGILNAFMPMSEGVTGGLQEMSEKFANWSANLGSNQGFQSFLDIAQQAGPRLARILGVVADAFVKIASAAGPMSGIGLKLLEIFAQIVDAIPTPVLQLLVPVILAVNTAMKLYAIYQSAAAAATWLFTTSVTTNSGIIASSRVVLALYYVQLGLTTAATYVMTAATTAWSVVTRVATLVMTGMRVALTALRVAALFTAGAFRALAVAMLSNPVGLIITALVALGVAFYVLWKKSETFRNIVKGAWEGIKVAALAVGRWFAGPFVNFFKAAWDYIYTFLVGPYIWFFTKAIPAAGRALKDAALATWQAVSNAAKVAWDYIYKFLVYPYVWFFTKALPAAARTLRDQAALALSALRDRILAIWDFINRRFVQPNIVAFTQTIPNAARALRDRAVAALTILRDRALAIWDFINRRFVRPNVIAWTQTVPNAAKALRDRVTGFFGGMRDQISGAWGSIRNRTLSPMQSFFTKSVPGWAKSMRDRVVGFFGSMRDGLGTAWSGIRDKARGPINWVLDHVWNRGIVPTWGRIAGWIGIKNTLKNVKMLASGGTVGNQPFGLFNRPTAIVGEGNPMYPEYVIPTDPKYKGRARRLWEAAGGHFMADGGILGKIGGWLGNAASSVAGTVKGAADFLSDPVAKAKKMLLGSLKGRDGTFLSSPWVKMTQQLPRLAVNGLIEAVKKVGGSFLGAIGLGPSGGSGVQRWKTVVLTALRMVGQVPALLNITLRRMNQESGGNPNIVNRWDSNWKAGHPSVGLMQVIGPTFRSYAGKLKNTGPFLYGVSVNPLANVYASMRYALSRYGSLTSAYGRAGGYRNGTTSAAGGMHLFGEAGPEMGFSPAGWRILNARQTAGLGGGLVIERLVLENHGVIGSQYEVENWLVETLTTLKRKGRLP